MEEGLGGGQVQNVSYELLIRKVWGGRVQDSERQ